MQERGLADHGWTYIKINDCWSGERDPVSKAMRPNNKFGDMKELTDFVNRQGFKLGIYSTAWISTSAGYVGGDAPNPEPDYSDFYLPLDQRNVPTQIFGRYPLAIERGLGKIGPVRLIDRDAKQFADWGIDYVKYDWLEPVTGNDTKAGNSPDSKMPQMKSEADTKRVFDTFQTLDRDIVVSLSPKLSEQEDAFVTCYCNLWRLMGDIHASFSRMIAPFRTEIRLRLSRARCYGGLDMLQIGPLGKPNQAETVFSPSPLIPAEQFLQGSLWALLTQPLLLSCHIPTMDDSDLGLVSIDEVSAVNHDSLCRQAHRINHQAGDFEIWAKDLADGGKAVGLFNLAKADRALTITRAQLRGGGKVRDLWRQKEAGNLENPFSAKVSCHGAVLIKVGGSQP